MQLYGTQGARALDPLEALEATMAAVVIVVAAAVRRHLKPMHMAARP
jgi:hypothetical protein